jgi:hypothetical protein
MRNISLFAVAVVLIATGFGAWAAWSKLPSIESSILEQMLNGKSPDFDRLAPLPVPPTQTVSGHDTSSRFEPAPR